MLNAFLAWLMPVRARHPATFDQELGEQAEQILSVGSLFFVFVWLPYPRLDALLHPEAPSIPAMRYGLSAMALVVLVCGWVPALRVSSRWRLFALVLYMQVVTGAIAGLAGGDAAYIGGFLLVLMVAPAVPLPLWQSVASVALSLVAFVVVGSWNGMDLSQPSSQYSVVDLVTAAVGVPMLCFMLDFSRRNSWLKSREIERQRAELAADKARIDALLHNILPAPIVRELAANNHVEPRLHPHATVLFTDFVGFTRLAEQVTPRELVDALHESFSIFDDVVARSGLEKLKTIGDAYMAAAGVPEATPTHAVDAVLAALTLTRIVAERAAQRTAVGLPAWQVRVGLHSGPLVAGIVGTTKFAYDVWGDTVNLASRLESSGEPGRVNISSATRDLVDAFFETTSRGQVPAKNKGTVEMFFVIGLRPALSVDGAGIEPNQAFHASREALGAVSGRGATATGSSSA